MSNYPWGANLDPRAPWNEPMEVITKIEAEIKDLIDESEVTLVLHIEFSQSTCTMSAFEMRSEIEHYLVEHGYYEDYEDFQLLTFREI